MPMAPWRLEMSRFCGMNATVTSPGSPSSVKAGTGTLITVSRPANSEPSHLGIVRTIWGSKYFHPRISLADVGSASMAVLAENAGNCLSVASWQWSVFDCEIMTTSGAGSWLREETHGGALCVVIESLGCTTVEAPVSQGSSSILNGSAAVLLAKSDRRGSNERRKEASSLTCLTVTAILGDDSCAGETRTAQLTSFVHVKKR
jgi:hypothetical protein